MAQQHINYDIFVDKNGVAIVQARDMLTGGPVQNTFELQPGDIVTFTSNRVNSAIQFTVPPPLQTHQVTDPFNELSVNTPHRVAGLGKKFTVKNACSFSNAFHFECGRLKENGAFGAWGAVEGRAPGGDMPGPNDLIMDPLDGNR
jgi:hypothetical protein